MKEQPRLADLIKGATFDGCLLVRAAAQRTASNGSKYLDMTLCDVSAETNAKMWDGTAAAPEASSVVRVRGVMQEYNNRPQFRVDKMRAVTERDEVDMTLLAPVAPFPAEAMQIEIRARAEAMADEKLREIVLRRLDECGEALLYYPAASKLHHAEKSGLLHHTLGMLRMSAAVCQQYPGLNADLLAAGVILHDLCKISEMHSDKMGVVSDYSAEGMLIGHLVQGVAELNRLGHALGTPKETLMLLEHMVLSHHDLPEYGSPKPPMFPEAEVLHQLDMLDARMFEMFRELEGIKPGAFTEKIWSLDRKLYKHK